MKTTPHTPEPARWRRRLLHERAAEYSRLTGTAKAVAARQGLSARMIQYTNATDPEKPGAPQHLIEYLDRLISERTSPWPLIVMLMERAEERTLELHGDQLPAHLVERALRETEAQGIADPAEFRLVDLPNLAPADQVEVLREFVGRGVPHLIALLETMAYARAELRRIEGVS